MTPDLLLRPPLSALATAGLIILGLVCCSFVATALVNLRRR